MFSLIIDYNRWHYSYAIVNIFRLANNFVRFFIGLFSVTLFLKSLFSPIFSLPVSDVYSTEIGDVIESFLGGVLTRILGAIFRLAFIILGLLFCILTVVGFVFIFVVWIVMPIVVIGLLYSIPFFIVSLL